MTAESMWDVQQGVYGALIAASSLTTLLPKGAGAILDHVPAGTARPYIVVGEMRSSPEDTSGILGNRINITIHTYSQGQGMKEAKMIMQAIDDVLHRGQFAIPNQVLVLCQRLDTEIRLEEDGETRHGIQRFEIVTDPL